MNITFPDGSVRQYDDGVSALDIAASIGQRLRKSTFAAELDGSLCDASQPITGDHSLKLLSFSDPGDAGPTGIRRRIYWRRLLRGCSLTQSLR